MSRFDLRLLHETFCGQLDNKYNVYKFRQKKALLEGPFDDFQISLFHTRGLSVVETAFCS